MLRNDGDCLTSLKAFQDLEQQFPNRIRQFDLAARLFEDMMTRRDFPEFLTLVAYDHIN